MSVKNPEPKTNANAKAKATLRLWNRRGGSVPLSPSLICENMKIQVRRAKPMNRPMIFELFHEYVEPPHGRARSKQTTAGTRIEAPIRSSFRILWGIVKLSGLFSLWMCKKRTMTRIERAPIGKLRI